MRFLYHLVPRVMVGSELKPLNELRGTDPVLYLEYMRKYDDRPTLPLRIIPFLDCLWNDVVFLTAVSPRAIQTALREAGSTTMLRNSYAIDPFMLDRSKAVVYLYRGHGSRPGQYREFDPAKLDEYSRLPEETKAHFQARVREGKAPLVFHQVPHILYKGTINVEHAPIVRPD